MGWKLSAIIINPEADTNHENILRGMGFTDFKKMEDEAFDSCIYPDDDKIYIALYQNNLIITSATLPMAFYNEALSDIENKLIALFPHSEICAMSLVSSINLFAFALIKNGEKIRVKAGDADHGTVIDIGEPLEQEGRHR